MGLCIGIRCVIHLERVSLPSPWPGPVAGSPRASAPQPGVTVHGTSGDRLSALSSSIAVDGPGVVTASPNPPSWPAGVLAYLLAGVRPARRGRGCGHGCGRACQVVSGAGRGLGEARVPLRGGWPSRGLVGGKVCRLRERLITRCRRVTKLWCLCWSGVCGEFEDHFGRIEVERSDDVAVGRLLGSVVCRNVPAGPV
jgi:hypothetical protein